MADKDLNALFLDTLKDIYYAEKQIYKALPKMAKAAASEELRSGFEERAVHRQLIRAGPAQSGVYAQFVGTAGQAIELDDRAGRKLQKIAHRHARASDLERQRYGNVEDQIQVHFLATGAGGIGT